MVVQIGTEVVGFFMNDLTDAVLKEASTRWFVVISTFVQLACSLAVRMPLLSGGCPLSMIGWQKLVPKCAAICGLPMG